MRKRPCVESLQRLSINAPMHRPEIWQQTRNNVRANIYVNKSYMHCSEQCSKYCPTVTTRTWVQLHGHNMHYVSPHYWTGQGVQHNDNSIRCCYKSIISQYEILLQVWPMTNMNDTSNGVGGRVVQLAKCDTKVVKLISQLKYPVFKTHPS